MAPTPSAEPALDLGSLDPERPRLRIDGIDYRYRVDMDLDLVQLARIERVRARISTLAEAATGDPSAEANLEQAEAVSQLLREGVELVLYDALPDEVAAKLNDVQRLAIVDAFTRATLRAASRSASKARRALQELRQTLPRSSRSSSTSTPRPATRSG